MTETFGDYLHHGVCGSCRAIMDAYAAFRPDLSPTLREIERCVVRAKVAGKRELRGLKDRLTNLLFGAWTVDAHAGARLVRKIELYNPAKLREVMKEGKLWRSSGRRKNNQRMERFARKALRDGTIGDDVAYLWFDVKIDDVDQRPTMR